MTNYEKYFGSPERAAAMRVRYFKNYGGYLVLEQVVEGTWDYPQNTYTFSSTQEYLEWLQEECDEASD